MKKKKILILVLILLIVAIIITITLIIKLKQKDPNVIPEYLAEYGEGEYPREAEEFVKITNRHEFYTIKSIINNFLSYVKQVNGDQYVNLEKLEMTESKAKSELQKEGLKSIMAVLDEQYIQDIDVTEANLIKLFSKYKQEGNCKKTVDYNLNIKDIRIKDLDLGVTLVLVDMQVSGEDFNLLLKKDIQNTTYSIFLEDYIQKYNYSENTRKEDIKINKEQIKENGYNRFIPVVALSEYICTEYFTEFKRDLLHDPRAAYEVLDEEYREKKYGSYENFIKYIEQNREKIENIEIKKYNVVEQNGQEQFVCLDEEGKYYNYIFIEKDLVNYSVILDTYTVDLPQFTEEYQKNSDNKKVQMNIKKVFAALEDGDYRYVYNKLDETFKNNNFKTQEEFENYAKQTFENKTFKYVKCEDKGEIYVFDVRIMENDSELFKKQFIMKLEEGTEFIMSFSVK